MALLLLGISETFLWGGHVHTALLQPFVALFSCGGQGSLVLLCCRDGGETLVELVQEGGVQWKCFPEKP